MRKGHSFALTLFAFSLVSAAFVGAQSNAIVDRLLDEKQAAFGDAAYMILAASQLVPDDATPDQVAAVVSEKKLLNGTYKESDPVTLGEVSYLIMETLGMRGGLMYAIFPGPRYAARELAYRRLIVGNTHAYRTVSGEEVMHILNAALEAKGGSQ